MEQVLASNINEIIISDHATITCTMSPKGNPSQHKIWRMNRNVLTDKECIKHIKEHIDTFSKQTNRETRNRNHMGYIQSLH